MSIQQKGCFDIHGAFTEGCPVCLRWRDDPRYESLRNGEVQSGQTARKPLPVILECTNRGKAPIRTAGCPTCRGNVQLRVYSCLVHGECSFDKRAGVKVCDARCAERVAPG